MLCPTCGKDLKKGSRFCAYCGTTLSEEDLVERLEPEDVPPIEPPKPPEPATAKYAPPPLLTSPPPQTTAPAQMQPPVPPPPPSMPTPQPSFQSPPLPATATPVPPKERRRKPLVLLALIAIVFVLAAGGVLLAVVLTSTAKVEVPNLVGKNIAEVRQTLQQRGLNIEEAESSQSRYADGQVLSQNPDAAVSVAKGSTVRVVVNKRTEGGDSGQNTGDTGQDNNQNNQGEAQDISSAATITASSTLPSDAPGINYGTANLVDNDNSTCWAEGNPGYGINAWVKFTFQSDFQVTKLSVIPGLLKMDGDKDRWLQNGRLKTVNVIFDGGVQVSHTFQDEKTYQDITLPTPVKTRTVTVVIVDAYPGQSGPTWTVAQDTSVSEMHVFGYLPGV